MLGALSGDTIPDPLVAPSGRMLVVLYSDPNYVRRGFAANASAVATCAQAGCGLHGSCVGGRCVCDAGWTGWSCDACAVGYGGAGCGALPSGLNRWTARPAAGFGARAGHSSSLHYGSVWTFGGYADGAPLDTLVSHTPATGAWSTVAASGAAPAPRYWHAAAVIGDTLLVHGGVLSGPPPSAALGRGTTLEPRRDSAELWAFDLLGQGWSLRRPQGDAPPAVALHRMVTVGGRAYVVGGSTGSPRFLRDVYVYTAATDRWQRVATTGVSPPVAGHTAVYRAASDEILVFGGHTGTRSTWVDRGRGLHSFGVLTGHWTSHEPLNAAAVPRLSLHAAVLLPGGSEMLVYGGNQHVHYEDETCYADGVYVLRLDCDEWVHVAPSEGVGWPRRGRFAHSMVPLVPRGVLVLGGFSGQVRDDALSYEPPASVCEHAALDSCLRIRGCARARCPAPLNASAPFVPTCASAGALAADCVDEIEGACRGPCTWRDSCDSCAASALCGWCPRSGACVEVATTPACDAAEPFVTDCAAVQRSEMRGFILSEWTGEDQPSSSRAPQVGLRPEATSPVLPPGKRAMTLQAQLQLTVDGEYLFRLEAFTPAELLVWKGASTAAPAAAVVRLQTEAGQGGVGNFSIGQLSPTFVPGDRVLSIRITCTLAGVPNPDARTLACGVKWNRGGEVPQLEWIPGHVASPLLLDTPSCADVAHCGLCAADIRCSWCYGVGCVAVATADAECPAPRLVSDPDSCTTCSSRMDCISCMADDDLGCGWGPDNTCVEVGTTPFALVANASSCPTPCENRETCGECLRPGPFNSEFTCGWCESSASCIDFSEYVLAYTFGQCLDWYTGSDQPGRSVCPSCEQHTSCDACSRHVECGWCHNVTDPAAGVCSLGSPGYFTLPNGTAAPTAEGHSCLFALPDEGPAPTDAGNGTVSPPPPLDIGQWAYALCPDRDECALGVDDCAGNSSCINVYGAFECPCALGYSALGDDFSLRGRAADPCAPDCCEHATCALPMECVCDLGWYGAGCNQTCGCNLHAPCEVDVSSGAVSCGACEEGTSGPDCGVCAPGFFGNATDGGACSPCDCNGLGDPARGYCHPETGRCYCDAYSAGDGCQACEVGFVMLDGMCHALCGFDTRGEDDVQPLSLRQRLTRPRGGLTTRLLHYGTDVHSSCMWLIEGEPGQSVVLTVASIATECHYDMVHVFDGQDAATRRTLAVLAGIHPPPPIISTTGTMLVQWLSDANWVMSQERAIQATYEIADCPADCSGQGECLGRGQGCSCNPGYAGERCEQDVCPAACLAGAGNCVPAPGPECVCMPGFSGQACAVALEPTSWHLSADAIPGLAGHSAVYWAAEDATVLFGGATAVDGSELSDAVWFYRFAERRAQLAPVATVERPAPRHMHTAVLSGADEMVVFGGATGAAHYVADAWRCAFGSGAAVWSPIAASGDLPPAMMGHAAVVVERRMFVVGGLTAMGLQGTLFVLDLDTGVWSRAASAGATPDGAFGAAALYYPRARQIVLYGGQRQVRLMTPERDGPIVTRRSGFLHAYSVDNGEWATLLPHLKCDDAELDSECTARSLHSATLVGDRYLFGFGGCPFTHGATSPTRTENDECQSRDTLILDLECGEQLGWISIRLRPPTSSPLPMARSRHAAVLRTAGNSVAVLGGANGVALREVAEFTLPVPLQFCALHTAAEACLSDTAGCAWNVSAAACGWLEPGAEPPVGNATLVADANTTMCNAATGARQCSGAIRANCATPAVVCSKSPGAQCLDCLGNPSCPFCMAMRWHGNDASHDCAAAAVPCDATAGFFPAPLPDATPAWCASLAQTDSDLSECAWDARTRLCQPAAQVSNPASCEEPCGAANGNATACTSRARCQWCESNGLCYDGVAGETELSFGQCVRYPGDGP